jgi:hypothetical protein
MALKSLGVPIPDADIINNSNLHKKKDLQDQMAAQAKAAQETQQKQEQLEMEKLATLTNAANSKAESDRALASERLNKINLDAALSAERISRAEEDRTAGVLNLIKAAKELDGIELDQLIKAIGLVKQLEGEQEAKETQPNIERSA